jgi:hypothetical protein
MFDLINQKLFYRVNAEIPELDDSNLRNIFYTLLFLKEKSILNNLNKLTLDINRHIAVLFFATDKMWPRDIRKGCLSQFKKQEYNFFLKDKIDNRLDISNIKIDTIDFQNSFLKHLYINNKKEINIILQQIGGQVEIR